MSDSTDVKQNWFARHKVLTVVLVLVGIFIVGSISASGAKDVNTTPSSVSTSAQPATGEPKPAPAPLAKVGDTVNIGGDGGLAVTLLRVIDPAQGKNEFNSPDAGKRFVTINLKISNNGQSAASDNADNNTVVIGTDNQTYNDDLSDVSECTDFNYGSYTLSAGSSITGCVTFQLPSDVNVAKVQFTPHSGYDSHTGEWTIQ